eukprot:CAMPEP_0194069342 /NCGR_PEP_ID=MMETSP0009_2-20130614/87586_1 /TAXON_ID=210454 /ORGANISM="Grammatophora oceanica, Strain CCMP 410" /LENGTH=50 /DNA_ID=CAMNT_0038722517 /DNA_START=1369 /DNA_END=1521 /DNA_ORIENTATION=+
MAWFVKRCCYDQLWESGRLCDVYDRGVHLLNEVHVQGLSVGCEQLATYYT